ncbi:MAG TPA: aldo/keto reductase [Woeseiaceae bacterium]|nr:aldo/keto reductase [Woeseiaceae bacterium]
MTSGHTRRTFLQMSAATAVAQSLPGLADTAMSPMNTRRIPGTGEEIPVIGLGTSDEFESVPADGGAQLKAVLTTLAEHGGTLVDTAPAYGDSESVLGEFLADLGLTGRLFVSTKVSERGKEDGLRSLERSQRLLRKDPLDLVMVHSMVDADTQLDNLEAWKAEGRVRYIGITTSRESGFGQMEQIIRKRKLDFIQVNYSPFEMQAADRVIPAAAEHGVAVMINRAFGNGAYFGRVAGQKLPEWTADFDCESWAQLSLKYILGHPDVTCVLAATSNPRHMADNAGAGSGRVPDAAARVRIASFLQSL